MPPEPVDWLCSDVIAYPDRLLALVHRWIEAGAASHIVCTIKFQGPTDHDAAEAFAAIPGGAGRAPVPQQARTDIPMGCLLIGRPFG